MSSIDVPALLESVRAAEPQKYIDASEGVSLKRTARGQVVVRIHYTADPSRRSREWQEAERATYPSQGHWDREQEIVDEAGGGELVFRDMLVSHWKKIVITDPLFRPDPRWRVEGGFDHGSTNPTALERAYIDFEACIIMCGEYYMPGKQIWQHAEAIKLMADVEYMQACYADPAIFPKLHQQSNPKEEPKSTNDLYVENGIALFSQYFGDRGDLSFAARILSQHWANIGPTDQELARHSPEKQAEILKQYRKPTFRIVCRNYTDRPQHGLHQWDSPNLLWEMMQTRKEKLSASQLQQRNPSEKIVDKNNHATDSCKYLVLSQPEPAKKTAEERALEAIEHIPKTDPTSRIFAYSHALAKEEEHEDHPAVPIARTGQRRKRR